MSQEKVNGNKLINFCPYRKCDQNVVIITAVFLQDY